MKQPRKSGKYAEMISLIFLIAIFSTSEFARADTDAVISAMIDSESTCDNLNDRLEAATSAFLGEPYIVNGPLGEGPNGKYDQAPLYRTDGFDCTTYVETTLSLARATSLTDFQDKINHIRYKDGNVDYTTRNHFVEIDWNPNNIKAGIFEDVTPSLSSPPIQQVSATTISKRAWYQAKTLSALNVPGATPDLLQTLLAELQGEGAQFPDVYSELNYIGRDSLLSLKDQLPVPAVLNVVRMITSPAVQGRVPMVAHQVILLEQGGDLRVRQASSKTGIMQVTDESFEDFVQSLDDLSTDMGVNVLKIL